ncbi:MAG: PQQ-dependent sugar dehydrogenase [Pirellulales bacterium]
MNQQNRRVAFATAILMSAAATARSETGVVLERIASGLSRPVFITPAPGDDSRLFIVEQHTGRIKILNTADNSINAAPFLDIDGNATGNEQGVLGLAFHPDYANNGRFYVNLTASGGNGTTEIRQYQVSANPNVASTNFTRLLSYTQSDANHNAGWMAFNPALTPETTQYLYIAAGDGGAGNDTGSGHTEPGGNAQDITDNRLGKMLRIDVNGDDFPADANRNYAIPPTNPFVGATGDDEIWAYGLRNPWRNSFDRATGDLWIADVGQGQREEVNFQPAASAGGENYGWRVMEGTRCNRTGDPLPCNDPSFTPPVHEYNHDSSGGFSITGGYMYRGPIEAIQGQYFFTDYVSNNIWAFKYDGATKTEFAQWNSRLFTDAGSLANLSSFGEDNAGNVYLVSLDGEIHRMKSAVETARLVETGAEWKYLADGSNQMTAWRAADFDDGTWPSGPSQLGYGDNDEATTVPCGPSAPACTSNNFITTYFRHELTGNVDPSLVLSTTLEVVRDDGAAVYLNGQEVYRSSNLVANAAFDTPANPGSGDNELESVSLDPALLLPGRNVLAAEVHQSSATSSDISFDLRLSTIMRTPTPGDTNFDGVVDRTDAATLAAHYGLASGAMWIDGDFNADGMVNLADAAILQGHFTSALAASAATSVPEPASLVAAAIGICCILPRTLRRFAGRP